MSKNVVQPEAINDTIRRVRVTYWIIKATRAPTHTHTHTHTDKYVKLTAVPRQQWFRERASVLRQRCIACIVVCKIAFMRYCYLHLHILPYRNVCMSLSSLCTSSPLDTPRYIRSTNCESLHCVMQKSNTQTSCLLIQYNHKLQLCQHIAVVH